MGSESGVGSVATSVAPQAGQTEGAVVGAVEVGDPEVTTLRPQTGQVMYDMVYNAPVLLSVVRFRADSRYMD